MLRKLFLSGAFAFLAIFGAPALMAQGATVVVMDMYDHAEGAGNPFYWLESIPPLESYTIDSGGGGGVSVCGHGVFRPRATGNIGSAWEKSRDGGQIFYNTFVNDTSVTQSHSQEIAGKIICTYTGSLEVSVACATVGVSLEVSLKQTYPVVIPPRSKVTLRANANLMDRSIGMEKVCFECGVVGEQYDDWVTAARGINAYFQQN